jgi:hypothetical protein
MKAKDKAKELVYKYSHLVTSWDCYWDTEIPVEDRMEEMKECALIAIENEYNAKIQAYNEMAEFCPDVASQAIIYAEREREEVKQEINNL